MKSFSQNKAINKIRKLEFANFQFLISNFQSISNVLMSKFLKRVVVAFENWKIGNSLEIRNLKLQIRGLFSKMMPIEKDKVDNISLI